MIIRSFGHQNLHLFYRFPLIYPKMKVSFVILIFLSYEISGVSTLRSHLGATGIQLKVDGIVNQVRRKRQIFPSCPLECDRALGVSLEKDAGLTIKDVSNGIINRRLYEKDNFKIFCREFEVMKKCVENCDHFIGKDLLMKSYTAMDYLCIDHHDEFVDHLPCYRKAAKKLEGKCDERCGGSGFVAEKIDQIQQYSGERNVKGLLEVLGELCEHISCSLDCEIPTYDKVCNDNAPGKLLSNFATFGIQQSYEIMEQGGVGFMFPDQCKKIL